MMYSHPLHPDADAILEKLQQEEISALYHFTDVTNVPLICKTGNLYSKKILKEKGLFHKVKLGGNTLSLNLDEERDNENKISLSFKSNTPMAYKKIKQQQHLCFFLIKPEVATWLNVLFTDTNATSNDQKRSEGLEGLNNVHFDAICDPYPNFQDKYWKKYVQAEALVPEAIPLSYVTQIGFISEASMEYMRHLCESVSHFKSIPYHKFAIRPGLFPNMSSYTETPF